jgi:hypothetical protein
MGTLVETANELLIAWKQKPVQAKQPANWDQARNVASVAGTFLKALTGW